MGANGPCQVHVNFGQLGFVFIEANVKKWGLAPMTGSLAPPPPYGSEQGSILLEGGREGIREGHGYVSHFGHARSTSAQLRLGTRAPTSPGPQRSPTDISLAQLSLVDSQDDDAGEGSAASAAGAGPSFSMFEDHHDAPPDYESPKSSPSYERQHRLGEEDHDDERTPFIRHPPNGPPIPSYEAAVGETRRGRSDTRS